MVDGGEVIDRTIDSNNAISLQGEEQQENETDEQFEERVLNKRAAQMFYVIRTKLVEKENLMLSEFTHRSSKKMVSAGQGGRERERGHGFNSFRYFRLHKSSTRCWC